MSLSPKLSNLQFLVLGTLLQGSRPGHEIREELQRFGVKRSGPGFYQLMSRLEEAEFVDGNYQQEIVAGQIIRKRSYTLRAEGRAAWNQCRKFSESVIAEFDPSRA